MMFKTPQFWNQKKWINYILWPLSQIWILVSNWKWNRQTPECVSVPVICVGNAVMGGAGKTPTVLALVEILKELGHKPHILSRGYGAYIRDVINVDPSHHTYLQVGDEPLLLARSAPTWAGPNRVLSAKTAINHGATILLMDDGLQNNTLKKDLSFIVVDAIQGFGNRMVFPAGPLRESLSQCAQKAQAMIVIGEWSADVHLDDINLRPFEAVIKPIQRNKVSRVVVFCGMGYPEKFRQTLLELEYDIVDFIIFADHHPYTISDMLHLSKLKEEHDAVLMTTAKDWLRLPQSYRTSVEVLPIELQFIHKNKIAKFIETELEYIKKNKTTVHNNYN